jgi:hypothetical protein
MYFGEIFKFLKDVMDYCCEVLLIIWWIESTIDIDYIAFKFNIS